jgi:hypothetical protein
VIEEGNDLEEASDEPVMVAIDDSFPLDRPWYLSEYHFHRMHRLIVQSNTYNPKWLPAYLGHAPFMMVVPEGADPADAKFALGDSPMHRYFTHRFNEFVMDSQVV